MKKKEFVLRISRVSLLICGLWLSIACNRGYAQPNADKIDPQEKAFIDSKEACQAAGGTWSGYGSPENPGYCIRKYSDAGKPCVSSEECEGYCVTNKISELGKTGHCQASNFIGGCQTPIEEKFISCRTDDMVLKCPEQCGMFKGDWSE